MGKSAGVQKNLANYSANHRRSSGIIFLSNLQKVIGMYIFQTHHLLENNNKNLKPERKRKIGGEERNIIFQQIK